MCMKTFLWVEKYHDDDDDDDDALSPFIYWEVCTSGHFV